MEHKLIDIRKIEPDKDQPRKVFDKEGLKDLTKSIILHGLLQSIVVREANKDRYIIVAGERRYRACLMAGLKEISCHVINKGEYKELALIENIQRIELNPLEEAKAIEDLMKLKGYTQEEVARALGKTRSYISNKVRLLNLDDNTKRAMEEGLTEGHGRVILSLKTREQQAKLLDEIKRGNLTVRESESVAKQLKTLEIQKKYAKDQLSEDKSKKKDKYLVNALEEVERNLGTKVALKEGKNGGKLEIEYYSEEDLENLLELLLNA
ncbi:MAG: ParB/RepB/Spo0J family partition protein [Filifactoraceae bacterium]